MVLQSRLLSSRLMIPWTPVLQAVGTVLRL